MNNDILVSVWMICYNQENYICQAIDSILMQKVGFKYKLYIGDDCSTDKTREICIEYAKNNPDKIELILHEKNIGAINNAQSIYKACFNSGAKYMALLEGDDYWTDPLKLQKQVDFLEENEEFSVCGHETRIIYENTDKEPILFGDFPSNPFKGKQKKTYTIEDTFLGIICHTSSLVIRNTSIDYDMFHRIFKDVISGDNVLISLAAANGNIYLMDDIMSVYRINSGGITATSEKFTNKRGWLENKILLYSNLNKIFDFQYSDILNERILSYREQLFNFYWQRLLLRRRLKDFSNLITNFPARFWFIKAKKILNSKRSK